MPEITLALPVPAAYLVWPLLSVVAGLGVTAIVSPGAFAILAQRGGEWVDSRQLLERLDQPVDIDEPILRYSRTFGVAVVTAAGVLAYVYSAHA